MTTNFITYILIGALVIIGFYVIIKRFLKKKKERDNFNQFIKPKIKEKMKEQGYYNYAHEIVHRYHHALKNQNREGRVDVVLRIWNPKNPAETEKEVAYALTMREVPVGKKDFVWEVKSVMEMEIGSVEELLAEKEDRKKHKAKYFKQDTKKFLIEKKEKVTTAFKKKPVSDIEKTKKPGLVSSFLKKEPSKKEVKEEFEPVENPFDVLNDDSKKKH